jgi:hypothetical protein
VTSTCSTAATPTPSGGVIQDGTYALQSVTFYGPCPTFLPTDRILWVICGNAWETAQETTTNGTTSSLRVSLTTAIQSTSIQGAIGCESPGTSGGTTTWGYDASPGHLALYVQWGGGTVSVDSYTRQ